MHQGRARCGVLGVRGRAPSSGPPELHGAAAASGGEPRGARHGEPQGMGQGRGRGSAEAKLHPDEDALQLAVMKCLCHLAFSQEISRRELADPDVLDVLMAVRLSSTLAADVRKVADEATARIITAESCSSQQRSALLHIFRAEAQARGKQIPTTLRQILKLLGEELVDTQFLAHRFIEAAPATTASDEVMGWLSLLLDFIGAFNGALVCPGAVSATTCLLDAFPQNLPVQSHGLAALTALAVPWKEGRTVRLRNRHVYQCIRCNVSDTSMTKTPLCTWRRMRKRLLDRYKLHVQGQYTSFVLDVYIGEKCRWICRRSWFGGETW